MGKLCSRLTNRSQVKSDYYSSMKKYLLLLFFFSLSRNSSSIPRIFSVSNAVRKTLFRFIVDPEKIRNILDLRHRPVSQFPSTIKNNERGSLLVTPVTHYPNYHLYNIRIPTNDSSTRFLTTLRDIFPSPDLPQLNLITPYYYTPVFFITRKYNRKNKISRIPASERAFF